MGSISSYLEGKLLDHVFNGVTYTPPTTVYLAMSTADPTNDGSGLAEPGDTYARQAITFSAPSSRRVTQSGVVAFPTATASQGTWTHYAIMDAASAGNMLAFGSLDAPKVVIAGNTPQVASTQVYVEFSAGKISTYLAEALLNHAFRNTAYTSPSKYTCLTTATISDTSTGSTITEPGDTYTRKQVNNNGGASPTWDLAASSVVDNTHDITYPTPSASWGTIVASCICDAASAGNMLVYDNDVADQAVGASDPVSHAAGTWDISLS